MHLEMLYPLWNLNRGEEATEHRRHAAELVERNGYGRTTLLLAEDDFRRAYGAMEFDRLPALERRLEAAARGVAEIMARCRAALTPRESLIAWVTALGAMGVTGRTLGVMAAAERRWAEAGGYLDRAVQFCEEKGLVVELAHWRLALADALLHRNPMTGQPVSAIAPDSPRPLGEGQGEGLDEGPSPQPEEPSAEDRVRGRAAARPGAGGLPAPRQAAVRPGRLGPPRAAEGVDAEVDGTALPK